MGAEREHLASVVSSAVNVRSVGDIMTLTAAAATVLCGAATLKARTLKEVWNIAAVIPVDKGIESDNGGSNNGSSSDELIPEGNFLRICSRELLSRGGELLKRTRKGDLKMKSRHVARTITKKKKIPSALELELTMAKLLIICQHPRESRISSDPSMLMLNLLLDLGMSTYKECLIPNKLRLALNNMFNLTNEINQYTSYNVVHVGPGQRPGYPY